MKTIIIFTLVSFFYIGTSAQSASNDSLNAGGFGHFFVGPAFIQQPAKLTSYLKRTDILGSSYSPFSTGYTVGGEGFAVFNRFFIGGGGFGLITAVSSTDSGNATISIGGGYFKMGYKFYNKPNTFMYGYTGFGGMGYSIQLSNFTDSSYINFNRRIPVMPGKKETYSIGGFLFDIGIGIKTIALSHENRHHHKGGFMIGADAGCHVLMPLSEWTHRNDVVAGPPSLTTIFSPYIRVTIGGGGFTHR